jgi:hypothetical protein
VEILDSNYISSSIRFPNLKILWQYNILNANIDVIIGSWFFMGASLAVPLPRGGYKLLAEYLKPPEDHLDPSDNHLWYSGSNSHLFIHNRLAN